MKINNIRTSKLMQTVFGALLAILFCVTSVQEASAQVYRAQVGGKYGRTFPDNAFRGIMKIEQYPVVLLNGKRERLAPGTRVMDSMNRIIQPARLTGKRYAVNYVRSANGSLNTIWLLTKQEARERRQVEDPSWWEKAKDKFFDWASVLGGLGSMLL